MTEKTKMWQKIKNMFTYDTQIAQLHEKLQDHDRCLVDVNARLINLELRTVTPKKEAKVVRGRPRKK